MYLCTVQDLLYFACEQYRPDVLLLCTRRLLRGKLKQVRRQAPEDCLSVRPKLDFNAAPARMCCAAWQSTMGFVLFSDVRGLLSARVRSTTH